MVVMDEGLEGQPPFVVSDHNVTIVKKMVI